MISAGFTPQAGPQTAFIASPFDITVFGGARGGGKTTGSLGDFWIHAEDYHQAARGLMVRKSREDLKDTIHAAEEMYKGAARWTSKGSFFRFKNGAKLYCAYLEKDSDAEHYQGWSLTRIYVEELTQFPSASPILRLLAALRSKHGVPCQMKATCNPGGPGHHWVKLWVIDNGAYRAVADPDSGMTRIFIPSKISDNPKLLENDPGYIGRLKSSGSAQLVKAWLDGDWNIVEGSFFPEFSTSRHVLPAFSIPPDWIRFRSMDWGSARPFSVGWWAVVQDDLPIFGRVLPRNAIIRYREWYGAVDGQLNKGLKLPAERVAAGILSREVGPGGLREKIAYGVLDPSAFAVTSGPSIAETLLRHGTPFRRADNTRVSRDKRMGGWDQLRARLVGDEDGRPMMYFFETCRDLIRTLPLMQHDDNRPEDVDTDAEDHAADDTRYACLSRPFRQYRTAVDDRNPYLVKNAFKLHLLR